MRYKSPIRLLCKFSARLVREMYQSFSATIAQHDAFQDNTLAGIRNVRIKTRLDSFDAEFI